jgi:hypothetical protein
VRRVILLVLAAAGACDAGRAQATPASSVATVTASGSASGTTSRVAAVAPADDARKAVVIGTSGEVYDPDGKGAWIHKLPSTTANAVVAAGRAGGATDGTGGGAADGTIVAVGDGVVYRLAANGWSAIRLTQHGKAILGAGRRSLAAVGRQLFALDQLTGGEPTKLALAPSNIVAIGAGAKAIVVATEAGVWKLEGAKLVALKSLPAHLRIVSDRWAIADRGAVDLTTTRLTGWPSGLTIGVAAATSDGTLVAIGASRAGLELVTLRRGKLERDPLGVTGTAVGVVVDRAGRAVVALSDGRIAVRDKAGWTTTQVTDEPPAEHPGPAPATSP